MNVILKNRAILTVFMALVIAISSFVGIAQFYRNISARISLLNIDSSYSSTPVTILDRISKSLFSKNTNEKLPLSQKSSKKKNNKLSGLLFYFISALIVSKENSFILLLIVFTGTILAKLGKSQIQLDKDIGSVPKLRFYIWWSLRFLNPLQKCIQYLANKYDINPVLYTEEDSICLPVEQKPHLCKNEVRFFLCMYR